MKKKLITRLGATLVLSLALGFSSVSANEVLTQARPAHSISVGIMHGADSSFWDECVAQGIITAEAKEKALAYIADKDAELKAEMEKMAAMTPEERQAAFGGQTGSAEGEKQLFTKTFNINEELVSQGILTQTQADQLEAYSKEYSKKIREEHLNERVNRYVSEGIIDSATGTLVKEALLDAETHTENAAFVHVTEGEAGELVKERRELLTAPGEMREGDMHHVQGVAIAIQDMDGERPEGPGENGGDKVFQVRIYDGGLVQLVEKGIITEEQKDKMIASDEAYYAAQAQSGEIFHIAK